MFNGRLEQRLKDMQSEQDNTFISKDDLDTRQGLSLRDLLNVPIIYSKDLMQKKLPSISEMVSTFIKKINQLPQIRKRILHGDFHAPNITKDALGLIHFVDFSDVLFGEDPTWDLGKWLNHVNRLYRMVARRLDHSKESGLSFLFCDGIIYLNDTQPSNPKLKEINNKAILTFSKMVDAPYDLVAVRASAAEFIVNVSTLKRHIKFFPYTTKLVVVCIIDSYVKFLDKFESYVPENS